MIEILLKIGIVLTAVIVVQAFYNTRLYRQPKNHKNISAFASLCGFTFFILLVFWTLIDYAYCIPYARNIVRGMDAPFISFFNYLPKPFLLIWFVLPIVLVWLIFLFRGGFVYQKIKHDYMKFIKKHGSSTIVENKPVGIEDLTPKKVVETVKKEEVQPRTIKDYEEAVEQINNIEDEAIRRKAVAILGAKPDITADEAIKLAKIDEKQSEDWFNSISGKNDTAENTEELKPAPKDHIIINFNSIMPPQRYFLKDVKTHPFEHRTIKGMSKVIPLAKKQLVIGKTLDGYVAVYETKRGYQKLREIMSENSVDIANLQAKPSIVFFTQNQVKTEGLRDYLYSLKAGEKV